MGEMISGLNHTMRNALFAMSANLDVFEARFGERQDIAKYLEIQRQQLNRMTYLLQDLVEYGRPTRLGPAPEPIAEVIAQAMRDSEPLLESTGTVVEHTVAGGLPPLRMDSRCLALAFRNVIENAAQHSPRGSRLAVSVDRYREAGSTWVRSLIEDRGSGFQPEDLPRAFEPFFTRRRGGTGLGLAIARRVVEDHGGRISLTNRRDGGARMDIRLPIAE